MSGDTGSLVLGIETSCDETAAAVVRDGRVVCANVVASQVEMHAEFGGVFPEMASRQHVRDIVPVIERAMHDAAVTWADLTAIAVTHGPGLSGSLLVGVNAAKGLAMATGLPLCAVNHLEGHMYSNWLHTGGRVRTPPDPRDDARDDPPFPYLALIVSGGHTDLVHVRGHGVYDVLGSTRDDAAGEAFDKVARLLELGYPGGPAIMRAAEAGDSTAFAFPVADTEPPLDFSFSGLKTAVLRVVESIQADGREMPVADLAASFQHAAVKALVGRTIRALDRVRVEAVLLAGGVSANVPLREAMRASVPVPVRYPPIELCTDNAAMIASAGHFALAAGERSSLDFDVLPGLHLGR